MNQVKTWGMTGNKETLKSGLTGFRNAVDWADNRRKMAISRANTVFHRHNTEIKEKGNEEGEEEEGTEEDGGEEEEVGQEEFELEHPNDEFVDSAASARCHISFMTPSLTSASHPDEPVSTRSSATVCLAKS